MRRIPSLDGLRAVSILIVIVGHAAETSGAPALLHPTARFANLGVRVFFVISGYLITSLLMREREQTGRISLSDFYQRRAFRILPAAYVFITITVLLFYSRLKGVEIFGSYFYFQNFVYRDWHLAHLWSLSIEEQFYFVWPLVCAFAFTRMRSVAVWTIAAGPFLRVALYTAGFHSLERYSFTVADALATGCLLAIVWGSLGNYGDWLLSTWTALTAGILIFVIGAGYESSHPLFRKFYASVGLTLMHLLIAVLIYNAASRKYWILNWRPVSTIGVLSYSLYLWQQPFLEPHASTWFKVWPWNIGLAFLAALTSYYLVERPALRLRESISSRQQERHLRDQNPLGMAQSSSR